jgi:hypothetical protein
MAKQNLSFDDIFTAYYSLFRADSDIPTSADDEYTVGMRLANEAVNYWANYDGTYWKELFDTNQNDASGTQTITTGTTIYSAPTNFREAGGFVRVKDSNGNDLMRYPIIEPHEAQFKDTDANFCYFTTSPQYYSTGTASQSTTTITGVGTTWTSAMVGMEFVFATGESATITAFTSTTSLTVSVSQTVASTTYHIDTTGYKLHLNPAPTSNLNGLDIDYIYYKNPTNFTTGTSRTEMANPYFVVHRMLAMQFRAARNPYYSSALKDSENTIRTMQLDNNSGNWANPPAMADTSGTSFGG